VRPLVLGALGHAGGPVLSSPASLLFTARPGLHGGFAAWQARSRRVLAWLAASLLLGLGLAAFFWVPALVERQFVSLERLREGYLHYGNHFVFFWQFLDSAWGYGFSVVGSGDGMSFSLGWVYLFVVFLAAFSLRVVARDSGRHWQRFFAAAALGLCVLMLPGSTWL
jgi:hypothetical protein